MRERSWKITEAEQIEALEVLTEFNDRLVHNMEIIVKELKGERLDDTDQFFERDCGCRQLGDTGCKRNAGYAQ